ncbi:MAG: signal peptide peptidase SppA [Verrucomicrobiota bacterium]
MENKNGIFWMLGAALLFILQISLAANFLLVGVVLGLASIGGTSSFDEQLFDGKSGADRKVAIIDLRGVISYEVPGASGRPMMDDMLEQLKQAQEDEDVAAIVLNVDSPGGEITASDALYEEIKRCDKEKPVIVYINSLGASGAYYAALGARKIIASELSITGSIGVLLQTINYEKLANFIGIQTVTFKSGGMKDILNPSRPMTEEEKIYIQNMVGESYAKFVSVVVQRRNLDDQKFRASIGDGRILSGRAALGQGLIDGVGYLRDAIFQAKQMAKLKENAPAVRYIAPFHLGQLFRIFGKAAESSLRVQVGPEFRLEPGKLYYISPHIFAR